MIQQLSRRIRPRLEVLEDRCMPSTLTKFLDASGLSGLLPDGRHGTVPFEASQPGVPTQIVPFELAGSGSAPDGLPLFPGGVAPHDSAGRSNLGGKYTGDGSFTLLSFTSATTGTFQGSFDFVSKDGDQLACNYGAGAPGTFTITPVEQGKVIVQFLAVFTPIPSECTGRFEDIIGGGFTMVAVTEPLDPTPSAQGYTAPFKYSWEGQGMLLARSQPDAHQAKSIPFVALPLTFATPSGVAPFETAGAGHAPQGVPLIPGGTVPHDATGGINLLDTYHGTYSGPGEYTFLNFTSPTTGEFHGTFDFTAKNGDQLPCTYGASTPGTFTVYPVEGGKVVVQFVAVFAPVTTECTGAIASITGGNFLMIATTDPFDPTPNAQGSTEAFTYSWVGAGLFLENPQQGAHGHDDILGLFEFGELASHNPWANLADHGSGTPDRLHGTPDMASQTAAFPAQPAAKKPPFTEFGDPDTHALHRATAGDGIRSVTDGLFSALDDNLFTAVF